MGTTLTGTTPQDTYDSLIKVTDNGPLSGTAKYLSDGLGNDSALAMSTSRVGIGTATPNQPLTIGATNGYPVIDFENSNVAYGDVGYQVDKMVLSAYTTTPLTFWTNSNERLRIDSTGNVGIGTSSPEAVASSTTLQVNGADHSSVRTGTTAFGGYLATIPVVGVTAISNARNPITGTYNNTGVAASVISLFSESANAYITFSTATANNSNPSERVRVTSNGLTFNGDTAAANALDDYEEGTWTPAIAFGGASVGLTYVRNGGTYTKIGRKVTVCGDLILSAKGSSTGSATITGLPFTIGAATNFLPVPSFRFADMSFSGFVQGYGGVATTTINMEQVTSGAGAAPITHADFEDATQLMVSLTYFV